MGNLGFALAHARNAKLICCWKIGGDSKQQVNSGCTTATIMTKKTMQQESRYNERDEMMK